MKSRFAAVTVALLACIRFAHVHLLWSDEDYHLAAAIDMLRGKVPYRDFWYDKPPLSAVYYLASGGHPGWVLRGQDAIYVCVAAWLAYRVARALWGELEGWGAALLLAFFLTFYLPAAVIPFAADALLMTPHLAAVYCAIEGRAVWSGVWAGIGFLVNTKSVFVLASCAVWLWPQSLWLAAGFALPLVVGFFTALGFGAWPGYVEQVWTWGLIYARESPAGNVLLAGLHRTWDWAGFHSALVLGAGFALWKKFDLRLLLWIVFSFAAVCVGGRFVPRYFLQLLPPLAVVGARGIVLAGRRFGKHGLVVVCVLLLTPVLRFAPRYINQAHWADTVLDEDSQKAAAILVKQRAGSGDTLFVWGYRPGLYVYSRMSPPGLFWDSQPLTGVPADRHLSVSKPIYGGAAARNRMELVKSKPTFIVDGLGPLNPALSPDKYPEIARWLSGYRVTGRTALCVIYRRE